MLFSYKSKNKEGELSKGVIDAQDRFLAIKELKYRGDTPFHVEEVNKFKVNLEALNFFEKINTKELIMFAKNLSNMLRAGLSLSRALSVLEKQTKKESYLNKVLASLNSEINSGIPLSSGLAKFPKTFSKLFVSMTRAGEESGNLANSLNEISLILEKSNSLNKKIQGALMYPGIIMSIMLLVGVLMISFVVPTFAGIFKELSVELPLATRFIIWLGEYLSNNLLAVIIEIIIGIFILINFLQAKFMQKYVDWAIIKTPIIGDLARKINIARITRTMSSLLLAGISIIKAVEITTDVVQNVYYKQTLDEARKEIEKGSPFSKVFVENEFLYPIMVSKMIQVGEETGKISDMLLQISLIYEEEIENKTKNLSVIIEPVLMVVVGIGVGFFAISIISPLYSILNNIQ
jgi:type IV pilus assembly protein PilC